MIARVALGAAALGCVVVLALWLRAAGLEQQAQRISENPLRVADRGQAEHAEELFERAGSGNPDSRPDLLRGHLLLRSERYDEAVAVLSDLVEREPNNIEAWALLAGAAQRTDPRLSARARREVRRLNPLIDRGG